jgi:hypothetical protein
LLRASRRFQGDKLAEFHELIDDPAAFDRAWLW